MVQLEALHFAAGLRGWQSVDFVDEGISGARESRPGLDRLLKAARRRSVDLIAVVKLDRLARSLRQLVTIAAELEALAVDLIVIDQAIDTTLPTGRLLFHVLGAIAEFERDLIRDRVHAGLRRAQERGTRSGRPIGRPRVYKVEPEAIVNALRDSGGRVRAAARVLGVHPQVVRRFILAG